MVLSGLSAAGLIVRPRHGSDDMHARGVVPAVVLVAPPRCMVCMLEPAVSTRLWGSFELLGFSHFCTRTEGRWRRPVDLLAGLESFADMVIKAAGGAMLVGKAN